MTSRIVLLLLALLSAPSMAAIDTYEFRDEVQEQRYYHWVEELRCPKCQNQNLAGSDAPIAKDLREQLYQQLQQGRSDQEILAFMTARYGDFITYRPPVRKETWILWFGPLGVLALGFLLWGVLVWRGRRSEDRIEPPADDGEAVLAEQEQRLALARQLLKQQQDKTP